MQQNQAPIMVLNRDAKREQGRKAQIANIKAAKVRDRCLIKLRLSLTL